MENYVAALQSHLQILAPDAEVARAIHASIALLQAVGIPNDVKERERCEAVAAEVAQSHACAARTAAVARTRAQARSEVMVELELQAELTNAYAKLVTLYATRLGDLQSAAERVLDSWDTDEDVNESHLALGIVLQQSKVSEWARSKVP